jgi:hypothetical protein
MVGGDMDQNGMAVELQMLRTQLQQLERDRAQRESSASVSTQVENSKATVAAGENPKEFVEDWLEGLEDIDPVQILERLKAGAGDWFDELNDELKDVRPSTVLTIFGFGALVGRLTAKGD